MKVIKEDIPWTLMPITRTFHGEFLTIEKVCDGRLVLYSSFDENMPAKTYTITCVETDDKFNVNEVGKYFKTIMTDGSDGYYPLHIFIKEVKND